MNNRIFIQVASYRDPELKSTLRDCIAKADHPELLTFAIAWQHLERDLWDNLDEFKERYSYDCTPYMNRVICERSELLDGKIPTPTIMPSLAPSLTVVKIIDIKADESKGCCWARNQIQQLYQGEDYTLQIDSHMRFTKGWDTTLIAMNKQLKDLGYAKPILTGYIGCYDIFRNHVPENLLCSHKAKADYLKSELTHTRDIGACYMQYNGFHTQGWVEFRPSYIPNWETLGTPVHARFYSANFAFSDGSLCIEVQHDPEYLFHGEEISIAVRAYTHGYDWFHPHKAVVWHQYDRAGRDCSWDDKPAWWNQTNEISLRRNRILLGVDGEDHSQINFGKYGFGTARTLEDYEKYTGVNFRARRFAHSTHEAEERFLFGK